MEVIKIKTSQKEKKTRKHIDNKTNIYYDIFIRKNIAKFTYYDYLYIERQKTIHCIEIRETEAKYEAMSSNTIHNIHDKTYRKILDNKKYATYIINKALKLAKTIDEKEIEKYTNRYITEEYTDMVKAGIVDPVKVTRSALQNATSVASTLLTTESVVSNIKEDAPAMPAGGAPGMGMM